jgi:hypothetical protein
MKNIFLSIIVIGLLSVGCKKSYQGDTYDFTNSKAAYVEFPAPKKAIVATQGSAISVVVQMRYALTEDVSANYSITGTTAVITGTITIPRNTVKVTGSILLPSGIATAGTPVKAQLKLVSANKGAEILRVGFNDPSMEVIALTINP